MTMMRQHMDRIARESMIALVIIGGLGGYLANLLDLLARAHDPLTTIVFLRVIGVFLFPLGILLGLAGGLLP